jgi:hypothetical protein
MDFLAARRFLGALALVLIGIGLASACASPPVSQGTGVPGTLALSPAWGGGPPERGMLIMAAPLPGEGAQPVLDLVRPELLGLQVNVKALDSAGFYHALAGLKPRLGTALPVRVRYWTADAAGRNVQATGLVYLPDRAETPRALLLVCHGTQAVRDRVPSRLAGAERLIGLLAAASGLAVALPDYPGMGDGEGFHPYCHAASLGLAGLDMLRAAQAVMRDAWPEAPPAPVYISGYSEGGMAAMATFRELAATAPGEFPVAGVFPMAGPFDMSGTMRLMMAADAPVSQPYYLPFTVFGWYPAEGEALRPDRFFGPAILAELAVMFDGRTTGAAMNRRIVELQGVPEGKAVAARLLRLEARSALADPEHDPWGAQMLEALRRNDLYDWDCPKGVPLHLMATRADEQVPWGNSLLAAERLAARGAAVDFTELDQATHEKGGYEAYARMLVAVWRETGIAPR